MSTPEIEELLGYSINDSQTARYYALERAGVDTGMFSPTLAELGEERKNEPKGN